MYLVMYRIGGRKKECFSGKVEGTGKTQGGTSLVFLMGERRMAPLGQSLWLG